MPYSTDNINPFISDFNLYFALKLQYFHNTFFLEFITALIYLYEMRLGGKMTHELFL